MQLSFKLPDTNATLFYTVEERKLSICLQVMLRGITEGRLPGCCWEVQRLAECVLLPEIVLAANPAAK